MINSIEQALKDAAAIKQAKQAQEKSGEALAVWPGPGRGILPEAGLEPEKNPR